MDTPIFETSEYRLLTHLEEAIKQTPISIRNKKIKNTGKWLSKNAAPDFLYWCCETCHKILNEIPANHASLRGRNARIKSFLEPGKTVTLKQTDLIRSRKKDDLLENIRSDVKTIFKKSHSLKGFKSFKTDALPYLEERMAQILFALHNVDLANLDGLPGTAPNREKFLYELMIYLIMDRIDGMDSFGSESNRLTNFKTKWTAYILDRLFDASHLMLAQDKAEIREFHDLTKNELMKLESTLNNSPRYFHNFILNAKNLPNEVDRFDDIWKKYSRDYKKGLFSLEMSALRRLR